MTHLEHYRTIQTQKFCEVMHSCSFDLHHHAMVLYSSTPTKIFIMVLNMKIFLMPCYRISVSLPEAEACQGLKTLLMVPYTFLGDISTVR